MPTTPVPSYYDILNVATTATQDELKAAYRNAVKLNHPDKGGTPALFALVTAAYETLSDPAARAEYDRTLKAKPEPPPPPRTNPTPPPREPRTATQQSARTHASPTKDTWKPPPSARKPTAPKTPLPREWPSATPRVHPTRMQALILAAPLLLVAMANLFAIAYFSRNTQFPSYIVSAIMGVGAVAFPVAVTMRNTRDARFKPGMTVASFLLSFGPVVAVYLLAENRTIDIYAEILIPLGLAHLLINVLSIPVVRRIRNNRRLAKRIPEKVAQVHRIWGDPGRQRDALVAASLRRTEEASNNLAGHLPASSVLHSLIVNVNGQNFPVDHCLVRGNRVALIRVLPVPAGDYNWDGKYLTLNHSVMGVPTSADQFGYARYALAKYLGKKVHVESFIALESAGAVTITDLTRTIRNKNFVPGATFTTAPNMEVFIGSWLAEADAIIDREILYKLAPLVAAQ